MKKKPKRVKATSKKHSVKHVHHTAKKKPHPVHHPKKPAAHAAKKVTHHPVHKKTEPKFKKPNGMIVLIILFLGILSLYFVRPDLFSYKLGDRDIFFYILFVFGLIVGIIGVHKLKNKFKPKKEGVPIDPTKKKKILVLLLAFGLVIVVAGYLLQQKYVLWAGLATILVILVMLKKQKAGKKDSTSIVPRGKVELGRYETDFDALVKIVKDRGHVRIGAMARYFGINRKKMEDWATILEEHKLLDIHYPAVGDPILSIPVEEKASEVKIEAPKKVIDKKTLKFQGVGMLYFAIGFFGLLYCLYGILSGLTIEGVDQQTMSVLIYVGLAISVFTAVAGLMLKALKRIGYRLGKIASLLLILSVFGLPFGLIGLIVLMKKGSAESFGMQKKESKPSAGNLLKKMRLPKKEHKSTPKKNHKVPHKKHSVKHHSVRKRKK